MKILDIKILDIYEYFFFGGDTRGHGLMLFA